MSSGPNGRFFLSGWQAAVIFLFVLSILALVLTVLHVQAPGHTTSLGLVYRHQATTEHLEGQVEDLRRRLRRIEGIDVPLPEARQKVLPPGGGGIR